MFIKSKKNKAGEIIRWNNLTSTRTTVPGQRSSAPFLCVKEGTVDRRKKRSDRLKRTEYTNPSVFLRIAHLFSRHDGVNTSESAHGVPKRRCRDPAAPQRGTSCCGTCCRFQPCPFCPSKVGPYKENEPAKGLPTIVSEKVRLRDRKRNKIAPLYNLSCLEDQVCSAPFIDGAEFSLFAVSDLNISGSIL